MSTAIAVPEDDLVEDTRYHVNVKWDGDGEFARTFSTGKPPDPDIREFSVPTGRQALKLARVINGPGVASVYVCGEDVRVYVRNRVCWHFVEDEILRIVARELGLPQAELTTRIV